MDFAACFPFWNELTVDQQRRILAVSRPRRVAKGTVLHRGGLDCLGLVLVGSGQLRAYMLSDEGREITICRMFEMDICMLSASCVMPDIQMNIIIEAEKDCELWILSACLYQDLMKESPVIANYTTRLIGSHFSQLLWLVDQVMWKSFDRRLAEFLLEESILEGTPALQMTHERIANHLGTAREVVTRMLRYFQSEGMVRLTRGVVEIADEKALARLRDS